MWSGVLDKVWIVAAYGFCICGEIEPDVWRYSGVFVNILVLICSVYSLESMNAHNIVMVTHIFRYLDWMCNLNIADVKLSNIPPNIKTLLLALIQKFM